MTPRGWFLLIGWSFLVGVFIGCGDVTATMVETPPAAAGPDGGTVDATPAPGTTDAPTADVASSVGKDVGPPDAGATTADAGAAELGAPEHPALHCQGAAADYRLTVCKPGCGTCQKIGEASTFAAGCWTSDDFHCVASCAECR